MAGPIDSSNLNSAVQRAVESSYKRSYQHIADLQARLKSIERTERVYMVAIQNSTQFPPLHDGGLAFVQAEATWYYCDGLTWTPFGGGAGGGKPYTTFTIAASDSLAPNKNLADYVCDGTDDNLPINAALLIGGGVSLLDGNYNLTAPLGIGDYGSLIGMGMGVTILNGSGNLIEMGVSDTVQIARMTLTGGGIAVTVSTLDLYVSGVEFVNAATAVSLAAPLGCVVENCRFIGCGIGVDTFVPPA